MSKTILVTRGAGFIGSNFVLAERSGNSRVVNLDILSYAGNLLNLEQLDGDPDQIFIQEDMLDLELVRKLLKGYHPDAVVNFAADAFLSIMTLGRKLRDEEFTLEDFDLLKTIADQTARFILNRKLFEDFGEAREMEAFQNMSAFFVHDLKNLSATLALTLQNLPMHSDNPEYRQDAVKIIGGSVQRIQDICSRLSAFNRKHDLNLVPTALNAIVLSAISDFDSCADMVIQRDLSSIPPVRVDPDKIRSVLLNLLLNAREASGEQCLIKVSTSLGKGYVVISVRDNGCGISREFLDRELFRPFKSTKTKGLGIGLYHGKMIVQAHHGSIEVDSELGKGSEFRILLPVEV